MAHCGDLAGQLGFDNARLNDLLNQQRYAQQQGLAGLAGLASMGTRTYTASELNIRPEDLRIIGSKTKSFYDELQSEINEWLKDTI